ncbi:Kelch repeat-containing protein [Hyphobacterium sp.]|uniref:Kelch repeat-containing protein n=1 Tax=Hyphobacterium sp. TaxID=2004662 RepID=UPI003BA930CD
MRFDQFVLSLVCGAIFASAAVADGYWRRSAELLDPRAGLSAVTLDGRVYAAGGSGLTEPNSTVEVYDPSRLQWNEATGLPRGLERFGFATLDGRLYAAGGYAGPEQSRYSGLDLNNSGDFQRPAFEPLRPSAEMWSLNPAENIWQRETAMPGPKAAFQLVALNGLLYAIGGEEGSDGIFVFDPARRSWSEMDAPEEIARRGAASVARNGRIYFMGGVTQGVPTARVDIFDPETGSWSIGPAMPQPRAGHSAAVLDGAIHVLGGRGEGMSTTLSSHIRLDTGATQWADEPDLQSPRTDAAAVAINGELMIIGGGAGGGFFAPFTAIGGTDIFTPENN